MERGMFVCPDAGTPRASSPSQMSRMQVTSRRGWTGRRARVRCCVDAGGTTNFGCAPRQTRTGTTACFKSTEPVAAGGVSSVGAFPFAQQSAEGSAQQWPHSVSPQAGAQQTGPVARPEQSRSSRSRRRNIGVKDFSKDQAGSMGVQRCFRAKRSRTAAIPSPPFFRCADVIPKAAKELPQSKGA